MQGNAQQRACAYNVVLRRIFVKVLERAERSWHFLYLIKNQEGVVGINFSAGIQFQPHDQTLCVQIRGKQLFFHLNVEFTSETVEILVTANEVQVVGEGMSYDVSYQISSETQLRLNSLRGEDETCVHLTWGEDGLHVSTVQTSKLAIEDMMGEPREMPPGGFVIKYPNSVVD